MRTTAPPRFYAARLAGTSVFDPLGDAVATIRDVVVVPQSRSTARAVGFVVEVSAKRRVFLPITRVTSISPATSSPPGCSTCAASRSAPASCW